MADGVRLDQRHARNDIVFATDSQLRQLEVPSRNMPSQVPARQAISGNAG